MKREKNWYKIVFDVEQLSAQLGVRLIVDFQACMQRSDFPPELSLFERKGEQHSTLWTFYLPPAAGKYCPEILERYGAEKTPQPSPAELLVAVGTMRSIEQCIEGAEAAGPPEDFTGL